MNSQDLIQKIEKFVSYHEIKQNIEISDIDWKIGESNNVIFYHLNASEEAEKNLIARMSNVKNYLLVLNRKPKLSVPIDFCVASDFFESQKIILDYFYPFPENLKLVGVTGTNGKSSVVHYVREILNKTAAPTFSLGTIGLFNKENKKISESILTSPPFIENRKICSKLYKEGHDFGCFELSSHALIQNRFYQMNFTQLAWTNFSQDHLDYHGDLENYFQAKKKIFEYSKNKVLIANLPDNWIDKLPNGQFVNLKLVAEDWISQNQKLALTIGEKLLEKKLSLEGISQPEGRFEIISNQFILDYAHTPDALKNLCSEARRQYPNQSLIVLFGCGGNRDKKKRPLMAKTVSEFSDFQVITSDNPREEDPESIINDIIPGMTSDKYKIIVDRKEAIRWCVENAKQNDIILIAGKGHESYQEIKGQRHHFSDKEVVREFLDKAK